MDPVEFNDILEEITERLSSDYPTSAHYAHLPDMLEELLTEYIDSMLVDETLAEARRVLIKYMELFGQQTAYIIRHVVALCHTMSEGHRKDEKPSELPFEEIHLDNCPFSRNLIPLMPPPTLPLPVPAGLERPLPPRKDDLCLYDDEGNRIEMSHFLLSSTISEDGSLIPQGMSEPDLKTLTEELKASDKGTTNLPSSKGKGKGKGKGKSSTKAKGIGKPGGPSKLNAGQAYLMELVNSSKKDFGDDAFFGPYGVFAPAENFGPGGIYCPGGVSNTGAQPRDVPRSALSDSLRVCTASGTKAMTLESVLGASNTSAASGASDAGAAAQPDVNSTTGASGVSDTPDSDAATGENAGCKHNLSIKQMKGRIVETANRAAIRFANTREAYHARRAAERAAARAAERAAARAAARTAAAAAAAAGNTAPMNPNEQSDTNNKQE